MRTSGNCRMRVFRQILVYLEVRAWSNRRLPVHRKIIAANSKITAFPSTMRIVSQSGEYLSWLEFRAQYTRARAISGAEEYAICEGCTEMVIFPMFMGNTLLGICGLINSC